MTETGDITIYAPDNIVPGGDLAGESYAYYNLTTGARLDLTETEAVHSADWTIAFKRSVIKINSGPAGPGKVTGACVVAPPPISREEFADQTDKERKTLFDNLTSIPADTLFSEEGIEPAIFGWRKEKGEGEYEANVMKGWRLRLHDGETFAKMKLVGLDTDGTIILRYALQRAKGGPLLDEQEGRLAPGQAFDFEQGRVTTRDDARWDIDYSGDVIYLNSSVSGGGKAGALGSNKYGAQWKSLDDPGGAIAFFMDEYGSLFRSPKWYRYNIDGNHDIHPNGAVYCLRTRGGDYKVQIYDYFTHKGSDVGNIRFRYSKI